MVRKTFNNTELFRRDNDKYSFLSRNLSPKGFQISLKGRRRGKGPVPHIFCDMDGVLCDLDAGLLALLNNAIDSPLSYDKYIQKLIGRVRESNGDRQLFLRQMKKENASPQIEELAWELMHNNREFWATLSWNREGPQLWNFLASHYDVSLLTIPVDKESEEGKKDWAEKHLGIGRDKIFFSQQYKKDFGAPDRLLIDDSVINVHEFQKGGGKAVVFTTFCETLPLLIKHLVY